MRLLLLAVVFLSCKVLLAQDASFAEGTIEVGDRALPYRLLSPPKVEPGKRYPLILFLHGMGERGADNRAQLKYLPTLMAAKDRQEKNPCFLLAPQCPKDCNWNAVDWRNMRARGLGKKTWSQLAVIEALKKVVRSNPVDVDRIYLTGLSMGGFGAWELAARHPDWFASCVPVCGGGDPKFASRLLGMPIWAWHGAADRVVPPSASRVMVEALGEYGSSPLKFSELEGVGHNSWTVAYGDDGAIDWMFEHSRSLKRKLAGLEMLRRTPLIRKGERIAFLGDSITQAGAGPGGYVDLIKKVLAARGDLEDVVVIGAGISGHRVPDLEKRLERDVLNKGATLVFIYIGINDVWHSRSGRGTSAEDFEAGLIRIIDRIKKSGATVILATPTVIGERATGRNELDEMLDQFSAISRKVAAQAKVTTMDLRTEMTDHLAVLNASDLAKGILTTDGVHLNAAGNRFLADRTARSMVEALERRGPKLSRAAIDGAGWKKLTLADFINVNGTKETWTERDGSIVCSGIPLGGARSKIKYQNFELVLEWKHHRHAGNSGVFLWCPESAFTDLPPKKLPRSGIEVQVLDLGYEENWEKSKGSPSNWFTSHGDVFPVGSAKMTALTPQIEYSRPDGATYTVGNAKSSRSFPTKRLTRSAGQWNHYYIRAINAEVRLWVNGEEVNGGTQCSPSTGYLALESEGSTVEYRNIRLRELP
ncbi:MAG: alpha/beta fold hydrolase [Planctomycetota bacterium]